MFSTIKTVFGCANIIITGATRTIELGIRGAENEVKNLAEQRAKEIATEHKERMEDPSWVDAYREFREFTL